MCIEDFGEGWRRDVALGGAALKLACPGVGRILTVLSRTGAQTIGSTVVGAAAIEPWPPHPSDIEYRHTCTCEECQGRTVGATVKALTARIIALSTTPPITQDAVRLGYLPSARTLIEAEATRRGYLIHRENASLTDCYQRIQRTVIVDYDPDHEVLDVHVEPDTATAHPATLPGALTALTGP